jgi:hypothetical protein
MFFTIFNAISSFEWIVITLGLLTLVCIIYLIILYRKINRLVGPKANTIEEHLAELRSTLKSVQTFNKHVEEHLVSVEKRLRNSVQAVETVRFNAFRGDGSGGNQSFASALLTEEGDGVIISSLYSRDHMSVFAKPVKGAASTFELSQEEKQALDQAQKKVASHESRA